MQQLQQVLHAPLTVGDALGLLGLWCFSLRVHLWWVRRTATGRILEETGHHQRLLETTYAFASDYCRDSLHGWKYNRAVFYQHSCDLMTYRIAKGEIRLLYIYRRAPFEYEMIWLEPDPSYVPDKDADDGETEQSCVAGACTRVED